MAAHTASDAEAGSRANGDVEVNSGSLGDVEAVNKLDERKIRSPPFPAEASLLGDPFGVQELAYTSNTSTTTEHQQNPQQGLKVVFPAYFETDLEYCRYCEPSDPESVKAYLTNDLSIRRLDNIVGRLWIAGDIGYSLPLTEQVKRNRNILLTNRADMHMVTDVRRIYLKPLPDYLLNHNFWSLYLCPSDDVYRDAVGLLGTYTYALVHSKADFELAQSNKLVPDQLSWEQWTQFARSAMTPKARRNPRYLYSELSLARLNWYYRLTRGTTYFRQDSSNILVGSLVYITIVLTAMQVGLGTDRLKGTLSFQRASYGFTAFSILAPVIVLFVHWGLSVYRTLESLILSGRRINHFRKLDL